MKINTLSLPPRRQSERKIRKAAILIDYENVLEAVTRLGKLIDLKALVAAVIERVGVVKVALAFAPPHLVTDAHLEMFDVAGFDCCVYPRKTVYGKEKDRVDSRMIALSQKLFDEHSDVTDIIIVSNDGDFTPLATFFRHRGKRVVLFGLGDISLALRKAVDVIYEVPTKG